MKKIREYHIEAYWAAEAEKRERQKARQEKIGEGLILAVFFALWFAVTWGFCDLLFEVI